MWCNWPMRRCLSVCIGQRAWCLWLVLQNKIYQNLFCQSLWMYSFLRWNCKSHCTRAIFRMKIVCFSEMSVSYVSLHGHITIQKNNTVVFSTVRTSDLTQDSNSFAAVTSGISMWSHLSLVYVSFVKAAF
jgi:hypothetical protein